MDNERAMKILGAQRERIPLVKSQKRNSADFEKWHRDTEIAIEKIFGEETRHIKDFKDIYYYLPSYQMDTPDSEFDQAFKRGLDEADKILLSMIEEIEEYGLSQSTDRPIDSLEKVKNIFDKFHRVARQIRARHDNRDTINVEDEYDVQDLLHSILVLYFDDIRGEEWTPSYAGGCSRMDFLLKSEQIVIETKKSRKGLEAKQLGKELIEDIQKYKEHPDCKTLVCFAYDPEGRIANPRGIETDLSGTTDNLNVHVMIRPL